MLHANYARIFKNSSAVLLSMLLSLGFAVNFLDLNTSAASSDCKALPSSAIIPEIYQNRTLCSYKLKFGQVYLGNSNLKIKEVKKNKEVKIVDQTEKANWGKNGKPGKNLSTYIAKSKKLPLDLPFNTYKNKKLLPTQRNIGFVYGIASDGILVAYSKDKITSCVNNGFDVTELENKSAICSGKYIAVNLKTGDYVPRQTNYQQNSSKRIVRDTLPVVENVSCSNLDCSLKIENDPKIYRIGDCISSVACVSSFYDEARDQKRDFVVWATLTITGEDEFVCQNGTNLGVIPQFVGNKVCDSLNNPLDLNNASDVAELNKPNRGYDAVVKVPELQDFDYSGTAPNMANQQFYKFWKARFFQNELGQECATNILLSEEQENNPEAYYSPDESTCVGSLDAGNFLIFEIEGQQYVAYSYFVIGFENIDGVRHAVISVFENWAVDPDSGVVVE